MTVEAEILALEEARRRATLAGDATSLSGLLSERLVYMHANAGAEGKAAFLARVAGGTLDYRSLELSEVTVTLLDGAALVFARLRAEVDVAGRRRSLDNRMLNVWAREDGGWRLIATQPTPIPPPAPAPAPAPA